MISVCCPTCAKVVGYEESDVGIRVACPHCGQVYTIPAPGAVAAPSVPIVADPVPPSAPPPAPRRTLEPMLPDPDEIRIVEDPDLAPIVEQLDEVIPVEEPAPPPQPESPPLSQPVLAPEAPPEPEPIPRLELDPPPPEPVEAVETVEPVGTPTEVAPTDLAPSLAAAAVLAQSLPEKKESEPPPDVLEEVADEDDESRFLDDLEAVPDEKPARDEPREEDEAPAPRRPRKKRPRQRSRDADHPQWTEGLTRNRVLGGLGVCVSGFVLLGLLLHHLTASSEAAWHKAVCCGDVFALALLGVGLYFAIRG
jgi:hypothetical protein